MTPVVVSGAAGRLGQRILERVVSAEGLSLAGALVRKGAANVGQPAADGIAFSDRPSAVVRAGAVLIEAAPRASAIEHVLIAKEVGASVVMATTGFDADEKAAIEEAAKKTPIVWAPNLSLGVAVLRDLVSRASKALPSYHLEVLELHHAKKKDAPSGTAWALAKDAASARGRDIDRDAILARAGETGVRGQHEVGMQSIRGGDIIGEHTVYLVGPSERIELTHRAHTRDVFADGAVVAARFLAEPGRKPGLYDMQSVLGLRG